MLYVRYSQWTSSCAIECQEDQEELSPSPTEEPWPKKFPEPLSWRSDEEDEDSDFGEEQRDRYLKVSFLVWKDYVSKGKCFVYIWMVSFPGQHFCRAPGFLHLPPAPRQPCARGLQWGRNLHPQPESAHIWVWLHAEALQIPTHPLREGAGCLR